MAEEAVIVAARRSPMGRALKGQFIHTRIDDMCAEVIKACFKSLPELKKEDLDDVLIGCAMPEGEQGLNVARNISFLAGIPFNVAAATVNRFCASSLTTINMAVANIESGNGEVFLAGGIESMSHVPMGGFNPSLNERLLVKKDCPQAYIGMGATAELLADKYSIDRKTQDAFAFGSHQKAVAAIESGAFQDEIVPVTAVQANGTTKLSDTDEGPRPDTTVEKLATLRPSFDKEGTVTAGNASPLTDGAAAVVVMAASRAKKLGIKPLARVVAFANAGVDPSTMGEGPIFAVPKAIKKAGMQLSDIELVELNEAFASQALAVVQALKIDHDRLNVHGGAIALGHPLGCTGARIMATLIHGLKTQNKTLGLETMCVGGGQGVATIIERL